MARRARPTATATAVTATAAAPTSTTTASAVSKTARVAASQQAVLSTIADAGRQQMEFQVKRLILRLH